MLPQSLCHCRLHTWCGSFLCPCHCRLCKFEMLSWYLLSSKFCLCFCGLLLLLLLLHLTKDTVHTSVMLKHCLPVRFSATSTIFCNLNFNWLKPACGSHNHATYAHMLQKQPAAWCNCSMVSTPSHQRDTGLLNKLQCEMTQVLSYVALNSICCRLAQSSLLRAS